MTQNEHVYAILCGLEVASDVISSANIKTIERYVVLNFESTSRSGQTSTVIAVKHCRPQKMMGSYLDKWRDALF